MKRSLAIAIAVLLVILFAICTVEYRHGINTGKWYEEDRIGEDSGNAVESVFYSSGQQDVFEHPGPIVLKFSPFRKNVVVTVGDEVQKSGYTPVYEDGLSATTGAEFEIGHEGWVYRCRTSVSDKAPKGEITLEVMSVGKRGIFLPIKKEQKTKITMDRTDDREKAGQSL